MLMNRKQIKSTLLDWQRFLTEAKAAPKSNIIIRLFDFDGTIFRHPDPQVDRVISNPYMAAHLNEDILKKLVKQCKIPSSVSKQLKDKSPKHYNFIISKVSSVGFGLSRAEIIGKTQAAADDNYRALKYVIEDVLSKKKDLESGDVEKLSKVLNFPSTEMSIDNAKIRTEHVIMAQETKIDEFLMKVKANIRKFYIKTNIAETRLQSEMGGRVERIPGTSGKTEIAEKIVARVLEAHPGEKFNFEVYDNNAVGIAEVTDGILLADKYVPNVTFLNQKEKDLFFKLFGELQRSPNVELEKFFASPTENGIEFRNVTDQYFTKSKGKSGQGDPVARFRVIKNQLLDLINFYTMGGKAAGRPKEVNIKAVQSYFDHHSSEYELLKKLFDDVNPYSRAAETASQEYTDPKVLNQFYDQVHKWLMDNSNFKVYLAKEGASFVEAGEIDTSGEASPVKAKRAKKQEVPAQDIEQPHQLRDPLEYGDDGEEDTSWQDQELAEPVDGEDGGYEDDDYDWQSDDNSLRENKIKKPLHESLRRVKLIIRPRK